MTDPKFEELLEDYGTAAQGMGFVIGERADDGLVVAAGNQCEAAAQALLSHVEALRAQRDALQAERDAARRELCEAKEWTESSLGSRPCDTVYTKHTAQEYAASRGWAGLFGKVE